MGLFPKEQTASSILMDAPRRMAWTRERGTRSLILWFVIVVGGWYGIGRIQDHFLLQKTYPPLAASPDGLTVVGTLDSRGDYEHNLFRVVQANQTSRVELTEFGWSTIFDDKNGPLFAPTVGEMIRGIQALDNDAGYKILEPYLRAGVAKAMGRTDWSSLVSNDTPLTIQEQRAKTTTTLQTTLGQYLKRHRDAAADAPQKSASDTPDVGSGSGREVDHGMVIPADSLAVTCPVVLTGANFTGGWLEEHPATMFDIATYTVHLDLNDEGRARFFQWSVSHENENLIFLLKHQVATAGRIRQTMNVNEWDIGPIHDAEMAKALVDFVNHK